MTDRILIKDLLVRGVIGVNDWEQKTRQDILINLEIYSDLKTAGASDRIEDTVNYKQITKSILK
ncbi:MAG TPA: dihydroneopterin aldolase, partial [bacterium]|nr:dihydroneopterin aldolase [bacterium]